jgi:hypothetical protein
MSFGEIDTASLICVSMARFLDGEVVSVDQAFTVLADCFTVRSHLQNE